MTIFFTGGRKRKRWNDFIGVRQKSVIVDIEKKRSSSLGGRGPWRGQESESVVRINNSIRKREKGRRSARAVKKRKTGTPKV